MKNKIDLLGLENKILNHFIDMDSDYLDNEMLEDFLSPYEILLLMVLIGDFTKIKIEIEKDTKTHYRYNNQLYEIPYIKILKKGE